MIHAQEAWEWSRGKRIVIAVVDSGVDLQHPDLRKNLLVLPGSDLVDPGSPDGPDDPNGHGTLVAGIAAARSGNGEGVAGVAPRAKIMPVRVCDVDGVCQKQHMVDGIRFAADQGADVINLSFGTSLVRSRVDGEGQAISEAVDYAESKGSVVVAAAGNFSMPFCQEPGATAICVGAVDRDESRSVYSNSDVLGQGRFLVAPGGSGLSALSGCRVEVISTFPVDLTGGCMNGTGYASAAGTSFASPFVAGTVALLLGQGHAPEEATARLLESARDLGIPGADPVYGQGLVDAAAAVAGETT